MHVRHHIALPALVLAFALHACGGASGAIPQNLATTGSLESPTTTAVPTAAAATSAVCPNAQTSHGQLDCTKLALGDRKFSTTGARVGYIYSCSTPSGSPVVSSAPWLGTSTWNALAKLAVRGTVAWPGSFHQSLGATTRTITGNGLPTTPESTGTYPISPSDPAYAYDRNPNHIAAQSVSLTLPANPTVAAAPTCLGGGSIGITVNGVAVYDGFDAAGYDAVAHEVQDGCHGHPDRSSTYHVHGWLQACVDDGGSATQNSSLLGYARDGFGIYGPWYGGKILTSADLDACHGTTSAVIWNGKLTTIYHYVSTYDFPYTLGCFRGTPTRA